MKPEWFILGFCAGFTFSLAFFSWMAGDCYLVEKPRGKKWG